MEEETAVEAPVENVAIALPDVTKDPELLAESQDDIKHLDVLVCGSCHEVFHFTEEFQEHKTPDKCTKVSKLITTCEGEGKPQVWGFTLWKNKQLGKEEFTVPSSWELYQRWCKLPSVEKDAWISAGQTIQFCTKISTAKISEFNKKEKIDEKDPLAIDVTISGDANSEVEPESAESAANTSDLIKKGVNKPVKLNKDVTILPSTKNGDTNKAFRTLKENEKQEYVVEKIVSKRFNPRRKYFEYQIKWENFDSDANTWEPLLHLTSCKTMVDEFEEVLRKQKAEKAKLAAVNSPSKGRGRGRPSLSSSVIGESTPGRPQRTSKQKALDQVKAWCGNISDADGEGGVKRAYEDDDSDDSFEKKMKFEDYSDDSDTAVKPTFTVKKVMKSTINNGVGRKLPQNVLIPDANGVVRINQKQLPSLSTGVYIMSKTAGIIKLDSSTSKVATSGGQTIVKVAPKIGQTQIKIVKKDGGTTSKIIQMTPKVVTPTRSFKPVVTKVKTPIEKPKPSSKVVAKEDEPPKLTSLSAIFGDDSDDGMEEMEFPKDLPLPVPDSPPRDFVLDPFTGKIAGQEYPEKLVEVDEIKTELSEANDLSAANSLENIVKLAAADITEEDLKAEPLLSTPSASIPAVVAPVEKTESNHKPLVATIVSTTAATTSSAVPFVTKVTTIPSAASRQSILNKALTNSNILHKNSPTARQKVVPRILNQSVLNRQSPNAHPVLKTVAQTSTMVRTKPQAPKPRFNISSSPTKFHEHPARNVYSKSGSGSGMRKIGQTTIYKSTPTPQRTQARIVQSHTNVFRATPKKENSHVAAANNRQMLLKQQQQQAKKSVISMPSLIGEEDAGESPAVAVAVAVAAPAEASPAETTDISSFTLADNENPIYITGDDGTVYQVAGQNEQGQTILITQGSDGQQQCLLVTNETTEEAAQGEGEGEMEVAATDVQEPLSVKVEPETSDQVVAQVVRAEPPSPGGTHKVVVMLPDGNLMVTQVSPEEYASLELD